MGSPKRSSYFDEANRNDFGDRMMYPLHYTGVKLIDLKNKFGMKYVTTNNTPGADISNKPDTDCSSFTKAHWRSMTPVVWECSRRICEIFCLGNE